MADEQLERASTRSLWEGISRTQIFDRGRYVKPNFSGKVKVVRTLAKLTRAQGMAFIVELEVLESNLPDEHPVGSKVTWFQKLIDKDIAFPAIAAWAAACAGYELHQKDDIKEKLMPHLQDIMTEATDNPDNNAFVNSKLHLETTPVKTKKDNRDFTRYDFSPSE
jgi:hypothetical protein